MATPNAILAIAPEERGLTIMAQYAITATNAMRDSVLHLIGPSL
jgi:hypothetical protein